jgi:hypothetical protein
LRFPHAIDSRFAQAWGEMDARDGAAGVEQLSERIAALAAERQELRKAGASYEVLEENRVRLGESQWALCHALIERHLPSLASA